MNIDDLSNYIEGRAESVDAYRSIENLNTNMREYEEIEKFGGDVRVFSKSPNLPKIEISLARGKKNVGPNIVIIDGDGAQFCHLVLKSYNSIVYLGGGCWAR